MPGNMKFKIIIINCLNPTKKAGPFATRKRPKRHPLPLSQLVEVRRLICQRENILLSDEQFQEKNSSNLTSTA